MAALGLFSGTLLTVEGGVGYIRGFTGPEAVRISSGLVEDIAVGSEIHYFCVATEAGPLAIRLLRIGRRRER